MFSVCSGAHVFLYFLLARDKRQLDVLLPEAVRLFIVGSSGLVDVKSEVLQGTWFFHSSVLLNNSVPSAFLDVIEADKCLVNTLFNSSAMRQTFEYV